jgi:LmbE family N-acetylglucosaminyl deacetylase
MLKQASKVPPDAREQVLNDAESHCREALVIRARFDEGRHPEHAATLQLLSEILEAQGHAEAAEQPRLQAKAIRDSMKPPAERGP